MNKTDKALYIVFFLTTCVCISWVYPQTIAQLEATDYFVWNDDYLRMKIAELPGITALLSDYLLQFFRWQGVGMTIEATVLTLTALLLADTPRRMVFSSYPALGLALPLASLFMALFQLEFYLQTFFMVLAIWLFFIIRKNWWKYAYLAVLCTTGLFLMPWTMMVMATLTIAIGWTIQERESISPQTSALRHHPSYFIPGIVFVLCNIWLYFEVGMMSRLVGFTPLDRRYFYSPIEGLNPWIYASLYLVLLMMAVKPVNRLHKSVRYGIQGGILITCIAVFYLICTNPQFLREEKGWQLAALAEKKEWKQILNTIPKKELSTNKAYLEYALLAEAGLGTLPDNIFNYPIIFSENLLYRSNSNAFCRNFNRQFYENLEIFDECFRQSYEFGIQCRNGAGFASMRQMVKYALLTDNFPVAEKYIAKLSKSTTHKSWARQWRQALDSQQQRNRTQTAKPVRANTFLGAYQLGVEMKGQLEFGKQNQSIVDYALVSFLLDCDLRNFLHVLTTYPVYSGRQLPKAYAEAVAMIIFDTGDESIRQYVSYSPQYDMQFRQFDAQYTALQENKGAENSKINFNKTYWNYFVKASQITPSQK